VEILRKTSKVSLDLPIIPRGVQGPRT
jgi:hypothetical protein